MCQRPGASGSRRGRGRGDDIGLAGTEAARDRIAGRVDDLGELLEQVLRAQLERDETPGGVVHGDHATDGARADGLDAHEFLVRAGALDENVVAHPDSRCARERNVLRGRACSHV